MRMPVRWQVIAIDYHFWLMAALSLWRHFSPNTLINSEATLWRASPASDSGKDSKMFEPCSQQTQRFCGKRRYEKNNWEQNTAVDFHRDMNLLHTNIKKDHEMCPHWLQRGVFWDQENSPYLLIIDSLIDWFTCLFVYSFIHPFSLLAMQISLLLFNLLSNIFTDPGLPSNRWPQRLNA